MISAALAKPTAPARFSVPERRPSSGRVSLERVVFTGRAASSEEKNKTKNTSFDSVFQNPSVSVAVEDCILYLLRSSLCVGLCDRELGVFF